MTPPKRYPNFYFENQVYKKGYRIIAGLDEVGRGALAGPVVCGCVAFHLGKNFKIPKDIKIDDSKKLSPLARIKTARWIKENALCWGIGSASAAEINRNKIVKAVSTGFRRAVLSANRKHNKRINFIIVDAFYIPYIRGIRMPLKKVKIRGRRLNGLKIKSNQLAVVNGDEKSLSVAAASIIAKVHRDRLMQRLGKIPGFKKYGWEKNKGYGTKKHLEAIKKNGPNRHHRRDFISRYID